MLEIGKVINSTPGTIQVILNGIEVFEENKTKIKVSKYISIENGNDLFILTSIQNICAVSKDSDTINYTISCTPIGCYYENDGKSYSAKAELIYRPLQNRPISQMIMSLILFLIVMIISHLGLENYLIMI